MEQHKKHEGLKLFDSIGIYCVRKVSTLAKNWKVQRLIGLQVYPIKEGARILILDNYWTNFSKKDGVKADVLASKEENLINSSVRNFVSLEI